MKKIILSILFATGLLCSSGVSAYVISGSIYDGTNVGTLDTLLGQTTGLPNSSTATETNWVNTLLDPDTTYVSKTEPVNYYSTDTAGVFAFQLQSEPGYFLIKNARWWALFENNADADWGVVNFLALNSGFELPDLEEMEISHVTEFGSYSHVVPEPSGLLLIGLGLLGLSAARRRQQTK